MVDQGAQDEKKVLADRLRDEASQTRPSFSEALHARICRAVEHRAMAGPPRPARLPRLGRAAIVGAVAASLAVGALYLAWRGTPQSGPVPKPGDVAGPGRQENVIVEPAPRANEGLQSPTDVPGNPAVDIGLLVDSTLTNRRWAYLDHDARLGARILLDQLPASLVWPEENP
ncbi:MAG: hypothetical protein A2V98_08110 [Planctomycetes bacterium RBG_16_64_12]|nr:MAG: hypothetical protein A2V98_08110 [Planctomycetes bacterium RBG_16_64_12]